MEMSTIHITRVTYSAVQRQKAVSAHFTNKQIQIFDFAGQY